MPDQRLDQLNEEITPDDGDLLYTVRNGADRKMLRGVLVSGLARETRSIITQNGIAGGGNLSADRTLSLDINGLAEDLTPAAAADFVVTHDTSAGTVKKVRLDRLPGGAGGASSNSFANIAVTGQSTVVATSATDTLTLVPGSNIALTTNSTTDTISIAATGLVPTGRTITAGAGLTGGGDLSTNRTISLNIQGQSEDASPVLANHYIVTHDTNANALRRIRASLLSGGTYVLPPATTTTRGGVTVGAGLAVDVDGLLSATYSLPTASASTIGGIRVGANLSITGAGILSATIPTASTTTLGGIRVGSGLTSDGTGLLSVIPPTPYTLPIASAGVLGGIRVGSGLSIDGSGILSASGGGSGGTFASTAEAQAMTSLTTYMNPARTKDAIAAYAGANELTGTEGQAVGFNASGDAVAVPNTKTVMIPIFAESASVATGTAIRKFKWPVSMKLTQVEVYTPTVGTTTTTIDVVISTSIFNSPPSIAANTSVANVVAFATASITKAQVVQINVTAAGTGAKGLWVTFSGIEI